MADPEKDTRISRRAERRARAQAEAGRGEKPTVASQQPIEPDKPRGERRREAARDRNQRIRERAAADRRNRRVEPEEDVVRGLDAGEMVDDAVARFSHNTLRWIRTHSALVQWSMVLIVVGFVGWRVVLWRTTRVLENSSDQLMDAVRAEQGTVGDLPPIVQPKEIDTRQQFNSEADRLKRAEELYRLALGGKATAAATTLARLGLAGVLFDQRRFDEGLAAYREVKDSALAKQDPDVRLRATEGIGLSLEAKGDKDGALAAFHELENSDLRDFAALGLYQQARLKFAKGERDQAKQLLAKLAEKTKKTDKDAKPAAPASDRTFVERAAEELEFALDPGKASSKVGLSGPTGSEQWSEQQLEQLRRLYENLQKQGKAPAGLPSGIPMPLPEPSPAP